MASFFRRKKGLIFKFVIGVPILWFATVLLMTYQGSWSQDNRVDTEKRNNEPVINAQHVPVNRHDDFRGHDQSIHQEEQQRLARKMEQEKLIKEREERERRNIELMEKQKVEEIKNNPVLKFRSGESEVERVKVDPNAPGGLSLKVSKYGFNSYNSLPGEHTINLKSIHLKIYLCI